jgi:plasmid stability protein
MGILVDLDDDETKRLSQRASAHGHSIEEEAKEILKDSLGRPRIVKPGEPTNLYDQIRADVERSGGGFEIEPLPRHYISDFPDFSGPEFDHLNKDDHS